MKQGGLKRGLAIAGCAIMATVTPARAQETGTLIQHKAAQGEYRGKNAARATMEQFAACLVSRSKGRVVKYASMRADDPGYRKYMSGLFEATGDECLSGGDLYFNPMIFRSTVFQALYNSDFASNPAPTDFTGVASTGFREAYGPQVASEAHTVVALEQFGECVARADGPGTRSLLKTVTGSAQETALFNQLIPKFSACIPNGETLSFSKIVLKGALAEGMYWLSKAVAQPAGTR